MMMRFDDTTSNNRINIYYNMAGIVVGADGQVGGSGQYGYVSAKSATFIDTAKRHWRGVQTAHDQRMRERCLARMIRSGPCQIQLCC